MTTEERETGGRSYAPSGRARRPGKSIVTAIQLAIALVLLAAVGQGLWSATRNASGDEHAQHEVLGLPKELGGLKLLGGVTGPEAIQSVDMLHGLQVEMTDARIGEYENNTTVWVGIARDAEQAATLVDRMTKQILAGSPAFSHVGEQQVAGLTVHQVQGGGQTHFYYQKGIEVIWVAAPPGAGGQFVSQAVQTIP